MRLQGDFLHMKTNVGKLLGTNRIASVLSVFAIFVVMTVLPGTYLSRESQGINPGKDRVRIALVATTEECLEAANRMKQFINQL